MTVKEVLEHYGNAYHFGIESGMSHTNIVRWNRIGYIPIESQFRIQAATDGELKASMKDSRVV